MLSSRPKSGPWRKYCEMALCPQTVSSLMSGFCSRCEWPVRRAAPRHPDSQANGSNGPSMICKLVSWLGMLRRLRWRQRAHFDKCCMVYERLLSALLQLLIIVVCNFVGVERSCPYVPQPETIFLTKKRMKILPSPFCVTAYGDTFCNSLYLIHSFIQFHDHISSAPSGTRSA
ncbi:hypothetical protein ASD8599_03096 [Ascidiaceihabitans donghaensis]|uniref:Uncharacterized protein n=1 Tax=Ascidiaceihabitans donghaensis TaxID=1510460 RepID=A0A2R8BH12_9RHOB|nr:hypothetical protein ASD8599_03096 [Ascidiaceihabitans donghaensis]